VRVILWYVMLVQRWVLCVKYTIINCVPATHNQSKIASVNLMPHTKYNSKHPHPNSQCSQKEVGGGGSVVSSDDHRSKSQKTPNASIDRYKILCDHILSLTETQEYRFIDEYKEYTNELLDKITDINLMNPDPTIKDYVHSEHTLTKEKKSQNLKDYHFKQAKKRDPTPFIDV